MSLYGMGQRSGRQNRLYQCKDKQAWSIANMDAVKGHEGHHVQIKAKAE